MKSKSDIFEGQSLHVLIIIAALFLATNLSSYLGNNDKRLDVRENLTEIPTDSAMSMLDASDSGFELLANEKQKTRNLTGLFISIEILFLVALVIMWLRYRQNLKRRLIAEKEAEKLRIDNDNLRKDKQNAQQELDNLRLELNEIEEERDRLSSVLKERRDMTPEMMDIIYERLDMLNSLLAKEISSNDSYAQPILESIRKDREGFLNSTRRALGVSHPDFMAYLKDHSLTEEEINYVCLYAIGLRGKEIGEYIQMKRHYVMGSGIRKKLSIDEHETNLGPYIRRLMKEL